MGIEASYSVSDGLDTVGQTLTITITGTNDPPVFVAVTVPATILEDVAGTIDVTIEDLDQDDGTLQLSAQSLNTALLPSGHPYIQLSGSGSTRSVIVLPKADQHGNV